MLRSLGSSMKGISLPPGSKDQPEGYLTLSIEEISTEWQQRNEAQQKLKGKSAGREEETKMKTKATVELEMYLRWWRSHKEDKVFLTASDPSCCFPVSSLSAFSQYLRTSEHNGEPTTLKVLITQRPPATATTAAAATAGLSSSSQLAEAKRTHYGSATIPTDLLLALFSVTCDKQTTATLPIISALDKKTKRGELKISASWNRSDSFRREGSQGTVPTTSSSPNSSSQVNAQAQLSARVSNIYEKMISLDKRVRWSLQALSDEDGDASEDEDESEDQDQDEGRGTSRSPPFQFHFGQNLRAVDDPSTSPGLDRLSFKEPHPFTPQSHSLRQPPATFPSSPFSPSNWPRPPPLDGWTNGLADLESLTVSIKALGISGKKPMEVTEVRCCLLQQHHLFQLAQPISTSLRSFPLDLTHQFQIPRDKRKLENCNLFIEFWGYTRVDPSRTEKTLLGMQKINVAKALQGPPSPNPISLLIADVLDSFEIGSASVLITTHSPSLPPSNVPYKGTIEKGMGISLKSVPSDSLNLFVVISGPESGEKWETNTARGSANPTWGFDFMVHFQTGVLEMEKDRGPHLVFSLYHRSFQPSTPPSYHAGEHDTFLGEALVSLTVLHRGLREINGWYRVKDPSGDPCGQLKIKVSVASPTT